LCSRLFLFFFQSKIKKGVIIIGVIQNFRINGVDRERRDMLSNLVETNVYWIYQKLTVKIKIKNAENGPDGTQRNAKQMLLLCILPVQGVVMYVLYLRLVVVAMSCKRYKRYRHEKKEKRKKYVVRIHCILFPSGRRSGRRK
jgi:hypothetical protein